MDIVMIDGNGYETTKYIRSMGYIGIIIGIRGIVDDDSMKKAYKSGMNKICSKPIDLGSLFNIMSSSISCD